MTFAERGDRRPARSGDLRRTREQGSDHWPL